MIIHFNGIDREATKEEVAEIEATRAEARAEAEISTKADEARKKLKQETLKKLGVTADEIAALFS